MNTRPTSATAILACLLLALPLSLPAQTVPAAPAASAKPAASTPATPAASAPVVYFELTESGAGTPTVIEIPAKLLANAPAIAASLADDNGDSSASSSASSIIAAVALSAALALAGMYFLRPKRLLKAPAAAAIVLGLFALSAGLMRGDVSPPPVRHAPQVANHVTVKVVNQGNSVHIVVSRELLKALLAQTPQK
ncbi:MAG TPA: hypothetical protein VK737_04355 [Opitutales bacterium]|jgi:hypothetical protein|nr:hypothetical protein [Opitutales bacterium]